MNKSIVVYGGAGNVGYNIAEKIILMNRDAGVVVTLVDVPAARDRLRGCGRKLSEICAACGLDAAISCLSNDDAAVHEVLARSDIVINAAGIPRGITYDFGEGPVKIETREQVNRVNATIAADLAREVGEHARKRPVFIQIANQADTMARVAYEVLAPYGYDRRAICSLNSLDQARLRAAVAAELNVDIQEVGAFIGGTHDNNMVPLYSQLRVHGTVPSLSADQQQRITERTVTGGKWMLNKMGKTSEAEPGACAAAVVRALLRPDEKAVFNLGIFLEDEWDGAFAGGLMGLPCTVSAKGFVPIPQPDTLSAEELSDLKQAFMHAQEMYGEVKQVIEARK